MQKKGTEGMKYSNILKARNQFSARQEESEHKLVGQRGTLDVAGAQAETDGGGVGGDQPQAVQRGT